MEEGYLLLTGFLFFGLIIACTCQMYIWLANSYYYPTEPRAHSFIRGLLSIRLLRWQNLTELSTPSNFVCHPTPPPFVLHVLRGHIPRWYVKGNRKGLTLLTLIQLSLKSLPIHRMDNRIYKEACRIESKCVHNRDDLSLSLLAVLQFPKIKALWQSLKLRMLSLTACGHLRKKIFWRSACRITYNFG